MNLPDKFQFQHVDYKGFTNTAKKNAHGDYEVKWARGYAEAVRIFPNKVFREHEVALFVRNDFAWILVGDKPKVEAKKELPNEFYFTCAGGTSKKCYKASLKTHYYNVTWQGDDKGTVYHEKIVVANIENGNWEIIEKKSLTAEQIRFNKEYNEQVQQLENSIRIQEQTVAHHNRMISNYRERIKDLQAKIVEEF